MRSSAAPADPPSILHVGIFPPPTDGGIAAYLEGMLASSLAQRFELETFDMRASAFHRKHRLARLGLGLHRLRRFRHTLRGSRARIVHVHTSAHLGFWERAAYGEVAARQGRAYVLHVHGGDFDRFLMQMPDWQRRFAARAFGRASGVVVLSEAWKPLFASWVAPERLRVIPNAIHSAAFVRAAGPRAPGPVRILFVGMLSARKGLDELGAALARLLADGVRNFVLDLLGGEEVLGDGKRYRQRFHEMGLDPWIRFHGLKTGTDKLDFYHRADLFVLPSRSESFGIVNLEAMASGLPVISTRTGAVPEYIISGEHGLLIEPGDSAALAHALHRLIEDEPLRTRLGAAGQRQAERYDWRVVGRALERLYDDILAGGAKPL